MYAVNATEVTGDVMIIETPRYYHNYDDAYADMITTILALYDPDGDDMISIKSAGDMGGYDVLFNQEKVGYYDERTFETTRWEGCCRYFYQMDITEFEPEDIK